MQRVWHGVGREMKQRRGQGQPGYSTSAEPSEYVQRGGNLMSFYLGKITGGGSSDDGLRERQGWWW